MRGRRQWKGEGASEAGNQRLDLDLAGALMGSLSTKAWLLCTSLGFILLPPLLGSSSPPRTEKQDLKHSCWNEAPAHHPTLLLLCGQQAPDVTPQLGAKDNPDGRAVWTLLPSLLSSLSLQVSASFEFFLGCYPSTLFHQFICPPSVPLWEQSETEEGGRETKMGRDRD